MDLYVEISEIVLMGDGADTRHTGIRKRQSSRTLFSSCVLGVSLGDVRFCHQALRLLDYSLR